MQPLQITSEAFRVTVTFASRNIFLWAGFARFENTGEGEVHVHGLEEDASIDIVEGAIAMAMTPEDLAALHRQTENNKAFENPLFNVEAAGNLYSPDPLGKVPEDMTFGVENPTYVAMSNMETSGEGQELVNLGQTDEKEADAHDYEPIGKPKEDSQEYEDVDKRTAQQETVAVTGNAEGDPKKSLQELAGANKKNEESLAAAIPIDAVQELSEEKSSAGVSEKSTDSEIQDTAEGIPEAAEGSVAKQDQQGNDNDDHDVDGQKDSSPDPNLLVNIGI